MNGKIDPGVFDVTLAEIQGAAARIAGRVRLTPSYHSPELSKILGAEVWIKCENLQLGGSFKLRGCFNKLLQMEASDPASNSARDVVTVSGGNHAISLSLAAKALGYQALVLMPEATPQLNIDLTRQAGGTVELCPDAANAFARAETYARSGKVYVHPYDDPAVIAGHGTVGLEMTADIPVALDHVFISIGGGGFIAGVATALKAGWPEAHIHGVETEGADAMTQALASGQPVSIKPSSIARTLGAPFVTHRTLAAAKAYLEDVMIVPDNDAVSALFSILELERLLVEPAAACVLAAALQMKSHFRKGQHVGLVLCGANVALEDALGWQQRLNP